MTDWQIIEADCVQAMAAMDEASVDAVVCDPPYGLEFMGKSWDGADGFRRSLNDADVGRDDPFGRASRTSPEYRAGKLFQAWSEQWAREALRVLKPGGHLLAFGGTRTYHRLACAIEDAGFEIRDTIAWMYGSGFPKSLDVGKAIDAAAICPLCEGEGRIQLINDAHVICNQCDGTGKPKRKIVGRYESPEGTSGRSDGSGVECMAGKGIGGLNPITAPVTLDAERWQGWGTALKPAHEPIVVARKPLSGTVAATVLEHGTGALNIDGCRVGQWSEFDQRNMAVSSRGDVVSERHTYGYDLQGSDAALEPNASGRWPANVVLDPEAAAMLDEQTGELSSGGPSRRPYEDQASSAWVQAGREGGPGKTVHGFPDSGGASRFFYCAKSSSAERNAGLDGFEAREVHIGNQRPGANGGLRDLRLGDDYVRQHAPKANAHPTVKPIALMRWLVRLVTPPGGLICDPFAGSGTTGIAAVLEGFRFAGIEREAEYAAIARARVEWWSRHPDGMELVKALEAEKERKAVADSGQLDIFEGVT